MRFFFYGTLIDPDVRRLVLARHAPPGVERAWLAGWRRVPIAGTTYPAIVRNPNYTVDGVLARGLARGAKALLERYEGAEYELVLVEVETESGQRRTANVFVPRAGRIKVGRGMWDYADWERRHKRRFVAVLARRGVPS